MRRGLLNNAIYAAGLDMISDISRGQMAPPPMTAVTDPANLFCFIESKPHFAKKKIHSSALVINDGAA